MLALFRARRKIVHCILSVVCSGAFRARRKIVDYILLFVPERSVRKLLGTNNNNKQGTIGMTISYYLVVCCSCWPRNTRAQDRLAHSVSRRKFSEGLQYRLGTNIHTQILCRYVRTHNVSTQYTSMVTKIW